METEIYSGNMKIISSGSFIACDEPVTISIKKGQEIISVEFYFESTADKEMKINVATEKDEKTNHVKIKLLLLNFDYAAGSGTTKPELIGNFDNGDKIYFFFWTKILGNSKNKEIKYSFYLGENK